MNITVGRRVPMKVSTSQQGVSMRVSGGSARIKPGTGAAYVKPPSTYDGPYTVTPSEETQVLPTDAAVLGGDITVGPIPSNYGRISREGNILLVY